ncbi:hypothetical protein LCGC14_0336480 [marine sediment metagenome]|uniref:Uncharacterized protein n=1 Tax=marine sediment metagenome TaxID=412755 RepID=A0A0F9WMH5_9ZZZZ
MGGPIVEIDLDQISRIIRAVERVEKLPPNPPAGRPRGPVPKPNLRHFELAAHLVPGGSALAYPRDFDGTDDYTTNLSGTKFTVHDLLGIHRGRAQGAYSSPHDDGSRGIAEKRNGLWQIIAMQPHALKIECLTNGAVLTTDANITVDNVKILFPVGAIFAEGLPTEIVNRFKDEADTNAIVTASWDDDIADDGVGSGSGGTGSGGSGADGRYACDDITCPA